MHSRSVSGERSPKSFALWCVRVYYFVYCYHGGELVINAICSLKFGGYYVIPSHPARFAVAPLEDTRRLDPINIISGLH